MRERILEILRSKMPAPVSGEVLSQELAVSRTAIWKHIQALKNEGYTIESVPKKGYILKEVPDRLKPAEVVANLKTKWLGHHIHYCELTTSTNELAKRLAGEGCEDGLVVIAEEQNSGKGAFVTRLVFSVCPWSMVFGCLKAAVHAAGSVEVYAAGSDCRRESRK